MKKYENVNLTLKINSEHITGCCFSVSTCGQSFSSNGEWFAFFVCSSTDFGGGVNGSQRKTSSTTNKRPLDC